MTLHAHVVFAQDAPEPDASPVSDAPLNAELDGSFRSIAVDCGSDLKVQARKGYYALSAGDANAAP